MGNNTARARLLAVEVLLAEPDDLNNALETDLWLLRDQLLENTSRAATQ